MRVSMATKKRPKKEFVPKIYSKGAKDNVKKIFNEVHANWIFGKSSHENHILVCQKLFGVPYMHESLEETRSCLSYTAGIIRYKRKMEDLVSFLTLHMEERILEIQSALDPENEQHLALVREVD